MNTEDLPAAARRVLSELNLHVQERIRPGGGLDLRVRAGGRGQRTYHVQLKSRMTAEAATALGPQRPGHLLVVAPHIPDSAARVLRERGIDYVDAAGNARLAWDGLLVDIRGRRPPVTARILAPPAAGRAFTAAGAQVTFVLLAWPQAASWPVRDIAAAAGVSLGTVSVVLSDLSAGGYLYEAPRRSVARGGELLSRWAEAYTVSLAPKLLLGRFDAPEVDWSAALKRLSAAGVQAGGELAASVLDPHLRPAGATLWADHLPVQLLARCRMRRAEQGDILVRRRFWDPILARHGVIEPWEPTPKAEDPGSPTDAVGLTSEAGPLVPSVLVYGDLVASGEPRLREHADRLRRRDDRLIRLDGS